MRGYSSCVRVSLVGDKAQFWGTYYTSGKLAGFAAGEGEIMNLLADPFTYGTEKLQHCWQSCEGLNCVSPQLHIKEILPPSLKLGIERHNLTQR